jgi:hypothetical protein
VAREPAPVTAETADEALAILREMSRKA